VPEDTLFALDDDLAEARDTLASMQAAGKSEVVCRKLVDDTKKEIETNVNNEQKILDGLDKGHACSALKREVDDEKVAKKNAETSEETAKKEMEKCFTATVTFGSRSFSSLKKGDCSWIFSHSSYTTAKAKYESAKTAHEKAQGATVVAKKAEEKAIGEAKEATRKCNCDTKLAHSTAVTNSHRNDAANKKAWDMAHRLECVLDGKTKCTIPAVPTTSVPSIAPEVAAQSCSGHVVINTKKEPKDKCVKWKAEQAANKEIADQLAKARVDFGGGSTALTSDGKKTLDETAKILNKYPWMSMEIRGHSDAPAGTRCDSLVKGRAETSMNYLKSKGVANTMKVMPGTCGKIRAITVRPIAVFNGASKPAGCK